VLQQASSKAAAASPPPPPPSFPAAPAQELLDDHDEHQHFSHRAPWLRAFVLGANDGLVSTAALMLGVGGAQPTLGAMRLAGVAALVAGALSMACGEPRPPPHPRMPAAHAARTCLPASQAPAAGPRPLAARACPGAGRKHAAMVPLPPSLPRSLHRPCDTVHATPPPSAPPPLTHPHPPPAAGEYISVASQKDAEEADIEKERAEQSKGPEARRRELEELVAIYMGRGLSEHLARQVAHELTGGLTGEGGGLNSCAVWRLWGRRCHGMRGPLLECLSSCWTAPRPPPPRPLLAPSPPSQALPSALPPPPSPPPTNLLPTSTPAARPSPASPPPCTCAEKDVIRAHARDELGIDLDELANPFQASATSALAFSAGSGLPLLAGACVRACVPACVRACVRACVCSPLLLRRLRQCGVGMRLWAVWLPGAVTRPLP
jgi:VIT1/CCC1 family predicted Fe2+/Mn2+ transporter